MGPGDETRLITRLVGEESGEEWGGGEDVGRGDL